MAISFTCSCGARFNVKDEHAGKLIECRHCRQTTRAPTIGVAPKGDSVFARDIFLLRAKGLALLGNYVWDENGQHILFIERPPKGPSGCLSVILALLAALFVLVIGAVAAFTLDHPVVSPLLLVADVIAALATLLIVLIRREPLRRVFVYRDPTRAEKLLEIRQVGRWQIPIARYDVVDGEGKLLARFKNTFRLHFHRNRWYINRPDGSLMCIVSEHYTLMPLLQQANFIFVAGPAATPIGLLNRREILHDRNVLDLSVDTEHLVDRRVALAMGILLETAEFREV